VVAAGLAWYAHFTAVQGRSTRAASGGMLAP
jgi:hypothetical protein